MDTLYTHRMIELIGKIFPGIKKTQDQWNKTNIALRRVSQSGFYEEQGFFRREKSFQGRPVIGRDTKVNGGVYIGDSSREAIVVDDSKDDSLNKTYRELRVRRYQKEKKGIDFKDQILEEVWALVQEVIPYNEEAVNKIENSLPEPDTKVYLSEFFGGGICRHQALLGAYLLERLKNEGFLRGKVSVDRNFVPDQGGHAWIRYETYDGEVMILDPAQNYIGSLYSVANTGRWFYERPEDKYTSLRLAKKIKHLFFG